MRTCSPHMMFKPLDGLLGKRIQFGNTWSVDPDVMLTRPVSMRCDLSDFSRDELFPIVPNFMLHLAASCCNPSGSTHYGSPWNATFTHAHTHTHQVERGIRTNTMSDSSARSNSSNTQLLNSQWMLFPVACTWTGVTRSLAVAGSRLRPLIWWMVLDQLRSAPPTLLQFIVLKISQTFVCF